ncbi:MAG: tRNA (guanosine(46)-N7)-methyltransferase TrmB [Ruminococcus sp.]|nr:tRNA (guanosine(46)-N7)-methyltransferase TrmB [Ruminococcus sp.]MBQ9514875.1 tRNA (guanosine(46)-N7)-methyltransferase TrmB [Ruminococcus sp.]
MRIRKKKWAEPELRECRYYVQDPESRRGRWREFFGNDRPIELEIGCGKCTFIAEKALRDPDTNFIAVDIKNDMLGVGRRNIEKIFEPSGHSPTNIALVRFNVEQLDLVIAPEDGIGTMYINFCNPWPRLKHNKRRLTYPKKLMMYKRFLTPDAKIFFKTDDDGLFNDSLEYFHTAGYEITYITRDLHNSPVTGNIVTEHEKMFSDEGIPIKYLEAKV